MVEFSGLRKKAISESQRRQEADTEAVKRRLASRGPGAMARAETMVKQEGGRQLDEQLQNIGFQEEQQKFAREERIGAQGFQSEEARKARGFQEQIFDKQLLEQQRQFDKEFELNHKVTFINLLQAVKDISSGQLTNAQEILKEAFQGGGYFGGNLQSGGSGGLDGGGTTSSGGGGSSGTSGKTGSGPSAGDQISLARDALKKHYQYYAGLDGYGYSRGPSAAGNEERNSYILKAKKRLAELDSAPNSRIIEMTRAFRSDIDADPARRKYEGTAAREFFRINRGKVNWGTFV